MERIVFFTGWGATETSPTATSTFWETERVGLIGLPLTLLRLRAHHTIGVVELGDVVRVAEETASFPIFRHNGLAAEMVQAELAGDFEAPLYGMIAVGKAVKPAMPKGGAGRCR